MNDSNLTALPKWIIAADNAENDILSYPVGSGYNVVIKTQDSN